MADLQERVNERIKSQRDRAQQLLDSAELIDPAAWTEHLVALQGWLKGIEDAIDEVVIEVEKLAARLDGKATTDDDNLGTGAEH